LIHDGQFDCQLGRSRSIVSTQVVPQFGADTSFSSNHHFPQLLRPSAPRPFRSPPRNTSTSHAPLIRLLPRSGPPPRNTNISHAPLIRPLPAVYASRTGMVSSIGRHWCCRGFSYVEHLVSIYVGGRARAESIFLQRNRHTMA
jgi:hypothetical protein